MNVQREHCDQTKPQQPQDVGSRHEVAAKVSQRLAVEIDVLGAQIEL